MPLKSFQPDLKVTVGTKAVKTYDYHSVILANYSEYVDTMLSVPMKEQRTRELTFSEIEPDVWEKMISYLEPGGCRNLTYKKILEVIGFYDKYQFKSGLALFDTIITEDFEHEEKRVGNIYGRLFGLVYSWEEYVKLAIATNGIGMRCEEKLKNFASEFLMTGIPYVVRTQDGFKQELFEDLLPVVSNDRKVLEFMVISVMGRVPMKQYSLEELQSIVSEDGFLDSLKTRCQIIDDQKQALDALDIEKVHMRHPYDFDSENGRLFYGPSEKDSADKRMKLGVMSHRFYYHYKGNDDRPSSNAIIYSADPFGSKWVISKYDKMEGEFGRLINEVCLFSWHGHGYTSLVPPKTGWRVYVIDGEENSNVPINQEIGLSYEIKPAKVGRF